jgi:hypothetical protein
MIVCIYCQYPRNPETATNCVKCRAVLSTRGSTLAEDDSYPGVIPSEGDGRRRTMADGVSPSPNFPPPTLENNPPASRWRDSADYDSPSVPVSSSQPGQRKATLYGGFSASDVAVDTGGAAAAQAAPGIRRIVGVLITYSWNPQGQMFPVLEGRNLIGKDPAQCNICIRQDATLSDVNSSIAYRSQFVIRDKDSMSGTFVDGAYVEAEPVPLRNYAKIRTGSTNWTFVAIQPPAASDPAASDV